MVHSGLPKLLRGPKALGMATFIWLPDVRRGDAAKKMVDTQWSPGVPVIWRAANTEGSAFASACDALVEA